MMTGKGSALFKKVISNRRHDHSLESELEWFLLPWIPERTLDAHVHTACFLCDKNPTAKDLRGLFRD